MPEPELTLGQVSDQGLALSAEGLVQHLEEVFGRPQVTPNRTLPEIMYAAGCEYVVRYAQDYLEQLKNEE
jgi:hypothetical protein